MHGVLTNPCQSPSCPSIQFDILISQDQYFKLLSISLNLIQLSFINPSHLYQIICSNLCNSKYLSLVFTDSLEYETDAEIPESPVAQTDIKELWVILEWEISQDQEILWVLIPCNFGGKPSQNELLV